MRLLECCDFQAICIDGDRYFSLPEQLIDKDYCVIGALRIASTTRADHFVFMGGTTEECDPPGRLAVVPAIGGS